MTTKSTLLITLFVLGILGGVQAQEKYEFAILKYSGLYLPKDRISISYSDREIERLPAAESETKDNHDTGPALKKVAKMQESGWELFNTSMDQGVYYFYMRKKQN